MGTSATLPLKHAYVLRHSYRLGNQLWNLIGIYAYCLERGYSCEDYASHDYRRWFDLPPVRSRYVRVICAAYDAVAGLSVPTPLGRYVSGKALRALQVLIVLPLIGLLPRVAPGPRLSPHLTAMRLPPSETVVPEDAAQIAHAEQSPGARLYFDGWLFWNPAGIVRYRTEILQLLKPKQHIERRVELFMAPQRTQYRHIVGVHIRQGDYRTWLRGKFWFSETDFATAMHEYLGRNGLRNSEVLFIVSSDGPVSHAAFAGLRTVRSLGGVLEDLLVLASCDCIIGSDSSFSAFSSFYGDIPHVILQRDGIDWEYYAGKTTYFENKYFQFVRLRGAGT